MLLWGSRALKELLAVSSFWDVPSCAAEPIGGIVLNVHTAF